LSGTTRETIYIDLPADSNMEDDQQRNIARIADAVNPEAITPGCGVVAGSPGAWVVGLRGIDDDFAYFRQIRAR
jgi:hypothetical protein